MSSADTTNRPVALVTGVSRKISIGAAIASTLAQAGWDLALTYWQPYDESMPWGSEPREILDLKKELEKAGATVSLHEANLEDIEVPTKLFDDLLEIHGSFGALILSHCHSVDSDILDTTPESFDRHFAVNARGAWLLIREFGRRFNGVPGSGRIIALTSDHTAFNLPYGASKGALDRIVIASAREFREKGITANVINPGATDTGWMDEPLKKAIGNITFSHRLGQPQDCANLVRFLCSEEGQWINGQLLFSDGGIE